MLRAARTPRMYSPWPVVYETAHGVKRLAQGGLSAHRSLAQARRMPGMHRYTPGVRPVCARYAQNTRMAATATAACREKNAARATENGGKRQDTGKQQGARIMSHIAVLGLGAMGKRMAANLLKAGHKVAVWNRSPHAGKELEAQGATRAHTPREAAAGADFVLVMVRDDAASRQVWLDAETGAFAGMSKSAVGMDSSTISVDWARALGAEAAKRGLTLLETPVSGSLPQAEAAQLIFLVGGDEAACERATPVLLAMGGAVRHAGPIGNGALTKLATNALLGIQVTALAELVGMLHRAGADEAKVMGIIATTAVWSPYAQRAIGPMLAGDFTPMFPVELVEKDFGYCIEAAGSPENAPTIAAAHGVFGAARERGLGDANLTSVVSLFRK